jgi:enoyl-[acyl-carrier-protein] reductase (NADH)
MASTTAQEVLKGAMAWVVGIANDSSIAHGIALDP